MYFVTSHLEPSVPAGFSIVEANSCSVGKEKNKKVDAGAESCSRYTALVVCPPSHQSAAQMANNYFLAAPVAAGGPPASSEIGVNLCHS